MTVAPPPEGASILSDTLDEDFSRRRGGIGAYIGYSPLCVPTVINGVKCVIVNEELKRLEPMAWDFVMNFARDNRLQVADACLLPDGKPAAR